VLIVGCGPAGLTLGTQLAAFPDLSRGIIEQTKGLLLIAQADGISGRASEIVNAFSFSGRVMSETYYLKGITFWQHDPDHPNIVRISKNTDGRYKVSDFSHVVPNQARVHDFMVEAMRKSSTQLEPDYCRRLLDIKQIILKSVFCFDLPSRISAVNGWFSDCRRGFVVLLVIFGTYFHSNLN
jgi:phenol 2-monooxygenase